MLGGGTKDRKARQIGSKPIHPAGTPIKQEARSRRKWSRLQTVGKELDLDLAALITKRLFCHEHVDGRRDNCYQARSRCTKSWSTENIPVA